MRSWLGVLALALVLAGGCEVRRGGSGISHGECQNRGHTPGTTAYDRCVRGVEGKKFLKEFERGH